MEKKLRKYFWFLARYDFNREREILTLRNRILGIASPCVNKLPYDFKPQSGIYFQKSFPFRVIEKYDNVLS